MDELGILDVGVGDDEPEEQLPEGVILVHPLPPEWAYPTSSTSRETGRSSGTTTTKQPSARVQPSQRTQMHGRRSSQQAGKPLEDFVKESIVDPNAYIQPGFPKSVMPSFSTLPADQLDALVMYLVKSSKGG